MPKNWFRWSYKKILAWDLLSTRSTNTPSSKEIIVCPRTVVHRNRLLRSKPTIPQESVRKNKSISESINLLFRITIPREDLTLFTLMINYRNSQWTSQTSVWVNRNSPHNMRTRKNTRLLSIQGSFLILCHNSTWNPAWVWSRASMTSRRRSISTLVPL